MNPDAALAAAVLALLRRVMKLARATRLRFDGDAGTALETARLVVQAAANGYLALASQPALAEDRRVAVAAAAHACRHAQGVLATHFPGHDALPSLADLGDPSGAALSQRFVAAAPIVSVSTSARSALDTLRRDPLVLADLPAEALQSLMASVAEGVVLSEPGA